MMKLISYVFPIYNESGNISLLYETISKLINEHSKYRYELLFINDGSADDSLDELEKIQSKDECVTVISFA